MAQPRDIPELNPQTIWPLMGPFAVPFMVTHTMMSAFAQMSQFWVDQVFEPHHVDSAVGHDLPVPDTFDEEKPHIDLFA